MIILDFLHKLFRVPYKLYVAHDTKNGVPVLFLHGIASDSSTWDTILPLLPSGVRAISLDVLGFGKSPKPKKIDYTPHDHVAAIIKTVSSLTGKQPVIVVGHSMGGLLAIELAKKQPELVKELILISTPLYKQEDIMVVTNKNATTKQAFYNSLFLLYERIMNNEKLTLKAAEAVMKLLPTAGGFTLSADTWVPFKKSLSNTIMKQNSLDDIAKLTLPMHLYYGMLDVLIQHKNYTELVALQKSNITITKLASAHMITKNSAKTIADELKTKI